MLEIIRRIPSWLKLLIIELLIIIVVSIVIILTGNKPKQEINAENPLNNSIESVDNKVEARIEFKDEQTYNNIITYRFVFKNKVDEEVSFNDSSIAFEDIMNEVNKKLATINNEVCSIGIVGKELYLQVDTRFSITEKQKMNIVTIKDNLPIDDWLELLELINDSNYVNADSLISHPTDIGNTHYIYVYTSLDNGTIVENSDNIISKEDVELAIEEQQEND